MKTYKNFQTILWYIVLGGVIADLAAIVYTAVRIYPPFSFFGILSYNVRLEMIEALIVPSLILAICFTLMYYLMKKIRFDALIIIDITLVIPLIIRLMSFMYKSDFFTTASYSASAFMLFFAFFSIVKICRSLMNIKPEKLFFMMYVCLTLLLCLTVASVITVIYSHIVANVYIWLAMPFFIVLINLFLFIETYAKFMSKRSFVTSFITAFLCSHLVFLFAYHPLISVIVTIAFLVIYLVSVFYDFEKFEKLNKKS